ncbi:hypothetical protein Desti_0971 [Desulfomonile tiedjei DSM 6799]|uniref:Uncharacterized protein n=1 Tax=Desulfomonile tiedjei (strain ATCC 49306 / DSM 6799 / DCB-1) TaxID=706587 RepID=I4C298_DESTA|nr:hypothetical protein Desti_0971 [Desulfomonile tiedjei DSM 6799]
MKSGTDSFGSASGWLVLKKVYFETLLVIRSSVIMLLSLGPTEISH